MQRVVLDTSVLVSGFIGSPNAAPSRAARAAIEERYRLVLSLRLLDELNDVLSRPKFARQAGDGRATRFVAALLRVAELHVDTPEPPAVTRDPEDDYLIALAQRAAADLLVSVDRDLLEADLALMIVTPAELLDRLT